MSFTVTNWFLSGWSISSAALSLGGCSLLLIFFHYVNSYNYWTKRGIKGPTPWPFLGNTLKILLWDFRYTQLEWLSKFGKVFGIYDGNRPILVVTDANLYRKLCIKDFDAFIDHDFAIYPTEYAKAFIFFMRGHHWKRVRALLTPTFTSGKIKRMFKALELCADDLIASFGDQLKQNNKTDNGIVNLKEAFNLYTLDTITSCCYGLRLERAGLTTMESVTKRNHLARAAIKIFEFSPLRMAVALVLPTSLCQWLNFEVFRTKDQEPLAKIARQMLERRKANAGNQKYDDYMQLLLDARLSESNEQDSDLQAGFDIEEAHHIGLSDESCNLKLDTDLANLGNTTGASDGKLSELEIISNAMFMIAVGLETTSTLLTNVTYSLAFHPEIQDRLYGELLAIKRQPANCGSETGQHQLSYEALASCTFLDCVISETLRILTPLVRTDRIAVRDYYLEELGLHLKKGSLVEFYTHSMHNDPDYWNEPERFDPNRFMPGQREKIIPGSYCPFGTGSRHCLGMRFSLAETKLALARTALEYKFEPDPKTQFPPEVTARVGFINIKNPSVRLIKRP